MRVGGKESMVSAVGRMKIGRQRGTFVDKRIRDNKWNREERASKAFDQSKIRWGGGRREGKSEWGQ